MFKKMSLPIMGVAFGALLIAPFSYGQEKITTTTTTVEESVQTKAPTSTKKVKRSAKRSTKPAAPPVEEKTTILSTTTTTVTPPPPKMVARKVYDEGTLKKLSHTLCTNGFKSYVGTVKENVCLNKATPPDIAYTCVWDQKGPLAYPPTPQGPCSLDFTEHKGGVTIRKDNFPNPPLPFGVEAQCCYRAAKGPEVPPSQ